MSPSHRLARRGSTILLGLLGGVTLLLLDGLSILPEAILVGGAAWVLWSLLPERRNPHSDSSRRRTPTGGAFPIGPTRSVRPPSING